ncbi:MAG: hypothetical protein FJ221_14905 [Lentisphaerae bacterium]|nr:hypothetical protein [Lentisphaerota bacterium]
MQSITRRDLLLAVAAGMAGIAGAGPRAARNGLLHLPKRRLWLAAAGPWRAAVADGGWIGWLEHEASGLVVGSGVAEDGEPLTPRVEWIDGGERFSNLHDAAASVAGVTDGDEIRFDVKTRLRGPGGRDPSAGRCPCDLQFCFVPGGVTIEAFMTGGDGRLVVPLIVGAADTVERIDGTTLRIRRARSVLTVEGTTPLQVPRGLEGRIRGASSGLRALPVELPPCAAGRCRASLRDES